MISPKRSGGTSTLGVYNKPTTGSKNYLSNPGEAATVGKVLVIKLNVVNVRKRPNLNAEIIEKLRKGSKLMILEYQDLWYKIKVAESGNIGYIHYSVTQ